MIRKLHSRYHTTVSTSWAKLPMTSKLTCMCKITGVPLSSLVGLMNMWLKVTLIKSTKSHSPTTNIIILILQHACNFQTSVLFEQCSFLLKITENKTDTYVDFLLSSPKFFPYALLCCDHLLTPLSSVWERPDIWVLHVKQPSAKMALLVTSMVFIPLSH